jgi:hypothetical protein
MPRVVSPDAFRVDHLKATVGPLKKCSTVVDFVAARAPRNNNFNFPEHSPSSVYLIQSKPVNNYKIQEYPTRYGIWFGPPPMRKLLAEQHLRRNVAENITEGLATIQPQHN